VHNTVLGTLDDNSLDTLLASAVSNIPGFDSNGEFAYLVAFVACSFPAAACSFPSALNIADTLRIALEYSHMY